jgi:hypothetical protein
MTTTTRLDSDAVWSAALAALQGQMTRNTFDDLLTGSRLAIIDPDRCRIAVRNRHAHEWLTAKWQPQVTRAISQAIGRPVQVEFVVVRESTPSPQPPTPNPQPPTPSPQPPTPNLERDFAGIDYAWLWKKTGFVMASDYAAKFWQPLLGSRAYALWLYVQAENKEPGLWTRPRRFSARALARTLRVGLRSITGGLRPCHLAEMQALVGEPLAACCDRYRPAAWGYETRGGEKQCMHWNPGALEELYQARLLGIRIEQGDHPRARKMHLQVWTLLPLLTPAQLDELSDLDQLEHDRWLERYGHLSNIDQARWERLTIPSLVPLMAGHAGRELTDAYQPNPLEANDGV